MWHILNFSCRFRAERSRLLARIFVKMVKIRNRPAEKVPSNITDSALKRSAFQRRKQYGAQLKKAGVISRAVKGDAATARPRASLNAGRKTSTSSNAPKRNTKTAATASDLPKFKSSVSRQEMEELGCLPVGILSSGSGFRDRKTALSFSPHTQAFERTPIRGTPLRGMSLAGQEKPERVAEVVATLQRLKEALANETATCAEVLTDLKGLELGRRSTVSDVAEFWLLKMQLLCESNDRKGAILAAVQAIFASKSRTVKAKLARELGSMLNAEIDSGELDSDNENEAQDDQAEKQGEKDNRDVSGLEEGLVNESNEVQNEPMGPDKENNIKEIDEKRRSSQTKGSDVSASPERLYTPPDIKTTPMVPSRSGSAAKSLRFTPLIASAQRVLTNSNRVKRLQVGTASAYKHSEKTTPLRRSRRIHSLQPQL